MAPEGRRIVAGHEPASLERIALGSIFFLGQGTLPRSKAFLLSQQRKAKGAGRAGRLSSRWLQQLRWRGGDVDPSASRDCIVDGRERALGPPHPNILPNIV